MHICLGSKKPWNFEKYPGDPKGKWDDLAKQVTEVYLVQKGPILERMHQFPKRRNEERRCTHALQRW